MSSPSPTRGPARETRLLLLTLGVSVGVLFLLARFRFPERPISDLATPQPLARLARTTTFEDLSATMVDLLHRAAEASVTLRVSGATEAEVEAGVPVAAGAGSAPGSGLWPGPGSGHEPGGRRLVQALRVRDDLALAVLPGDARVEAIDDEPVPVGASGNTASNTSGSTSSGASTNVIIARDEVRGLVLVRVPSRPTPSLATLPQREALGDTIGELLALPGFLAVIDAAPGGPAVHAEFVSRVSTHPHPAWDDVIALGGVTNVRPGAMVFTLSGRFVGMVLPDGDETIVAPVDALIARADRLTRGESVLAAHAGLAVQPLSPMLAKATKAINGVVIAAIDGAVAGAPLRVGDVIAAVDSDTIRSVSDWERVIGRHAPGTSVQLRIVRREGALQIPLTLTWRDAPLAPGDDGKAAAAASARRSDANASTLGLSLRAAPNNGGLEIQRVDTASPAARAGLQAGDRLTALPGAPTTPAKTPSRASAHAPSATAPAAITIAGVETAFKALASGDALLLAINRAGQPLVVAIEKP
jgi:hypothetical protein